ALFALHSSNNEAVVWMSARFDLLATCFGLAAIYAMTRSSIIGQLTAAILFFCALLSKEAAVALPIAAAAWTAFRMRTTTVKPVAFVLPWLLMLGGYSVLRRLGGGVAAAGGVSRIPELAVFIACLTAIVA